MTTEVYNVRAFGAKGDGQSKDTTALQTAVDKCAGGGGGQVLVPAGRYVTGTIRLKSHVELHLESGARIIGSPDRADYNADDEFPEDPPTLAGDASAAHLIVAYRAEDVSITGSGVIDGNGEAFLGSGPYRAAPSGYRVKPLRDPITGWRPGETVLFLGCRRVAIRDVALVNPPYWTMCIFACADVQIRGLTIANPPLTPNGDGIDIVSCRSVTVSDCIIRSGDDCLVLRTRAINDDTLPVSGPVCEDVTVTNCVLSTPCCAIRIGVADGIVRRCMISNIVVSEARTAIDMIARFADWHPHGTCIEDLHFSDFIANVCIPFVINVGAGASRPAAIRDVSFSRFHITATAGSQVAGSPEVPVERIRFSDIDWTLKNGTQNLELAENIPNQLSKRGYHGAAGEPALPYALYGVNLVDPEFDRIRFRWDTPSPIWRGGIGLSNSTGVERHQVTGDELSRGIAPS